MTDPAVAYLPDSDYGAYNRGKEAEIWLKAENGSDFLGVVWPGKCTNSVSHDYPDVPPKVSLFIPVKNPTL